MKPGVLRLHKKNFLPKRYEELQGLTSDTFHSPPRSFPVLQGTPSPWGGVLQSLPAGRSRAAAVPGERSGSRAEGWEQPQQAGEGAAPCRACAALLLPQRPTGERRSLGPPWDSRGGTEGAGSPLSNYLMKNACCEMSGMDPGPHMGVDCLPVPDATVTCTSPCLSQLVTSSLQSLGEHGAILPDVSEMLCTSSRMVLEVCL